MDINKLDIGGPEFSQCCFCIDLKLGAYILGCLCVGGTIWGIIDLFIVLGHISWTGFAFVILLLCQLPPGGAFLLMLKTNDEDSRWRFATWFLVFGVIGVITYFVLMIFRARLALESSLRSFISSYTFTSTGACVHTQRRVVSSPKRLLERPQSAERAVKFKLFLLRL